MNRLLKTLCGIKYIGFYIAMAGVLVSGTFSFIVYPRIADSYHAVLDSDHYGELGFNLWTRRAFSYTSATQPTVSRGPGYPLLIAGAIAIASDGYPYIVQGIQCVLFGLTSLIVFWMAQKLFSRTIAILSSVFCIVYPFLLWYTSRIWIETLVTFLFTALVASTLFLFIKPTILRAVLVGGLVGALVLCKSTFLPFVVIVPLLLGVLTRSNIKWHQLGGIVLTACLLALPWTLRNWNLTGKIIPVHVLAGWNLHMGDKFVDNYLHSPFSYDSLYGMGKAESDMPDAGSPWKLSGWPVEITQESALIERSITRYLTDPLFFLKKNIMNMWLFWTLGETPLKTLVIALIQIPLLVLFILSITRVAKLRKLKSIEGVHIFMVVSYFVLHLPIFAFARLSVVLIPTMAVYGIGILEPLLTQPKSSKMAEQSST